MFPTAKIATLSAVVSAALICGFSAAQGARSTVFSAETIKMQDRIPQDATGGVTVVIAYASAAGSGGAKVPVARAETKGDLLKAAPARSCADQAWPHISAECLAAANGTPVRQVSRTVTFEQRDGINSSTLVKGSALSVAAR